MTSKQRNFNSLLELLTAIPDECAAIAHFTAVRWKHGAFCPYCGSRRVYHFSDKKNHKCGDCRQRFSIKVGTIFEDSKLPLRTWMLAVWFISSHKKGISSVQLAKDLDVTQKTAWFMMHRLRHAARTRSFNRPLKGDIEVDEGFFGGKDGNKHKDQRGLKKKAIVVGLLERGGELRARKIDSLSRVSREILAHVQRGARLHTDDGNAYHHVSKFYQHETVNHRSGEYGRGPVHTNSIEGYWSQLKRQIYGIHHWVSAKHLGRYVAESVWRYNRRMLNEVPRFNELLALTDGRLKYAELIA